MRRCILSIFASLLISVGYSSERVSIAAAANLRDVMDELKGLYVAENPTVQINVNYGGSGVLLQQIVNGASYNLFFSADETYPQKLYEGGYTQGEPTRYACGLLLLYSRSIDLSQCGLDAFKQEKVLKIAVANPNAAPYGERAIEAIKELGIYDEVKSKIIYGENIGATAQYVFSGNADVGVIALSQAKSPTAQNDGYSYLIPEELYTPIVQSCVVVKQKSGGDEAAKFLSFVLSERCEEVWTKYGYKGVK